MDTLFFVIAKLGGFALRVETWLLLLALVAFVARGRRLQRGAAGLLALGILAIGVLPLGDLMLRPIEGQVPMAADIGGPDGTPDSTPDSAPDSTLDGIIVLGGSEDLAASRLSGQPQLNAGADRYLAALALAHRHPEARVLFTGGSGRLRDVAGAPSMHSEADIAADVFAAQGIAPERLLFEGRSRNTAENARLGLALAAPGPGERWALVTSASHMPRALGSFAAAGWDGVIPVPVDYRSRPFADGLGWNLPRNLGLMNIAIREWVGRAVYGATGR